MDKASVDRPAPKSPAPKSHRTVLIVCLGVTFGMLGAAFAAVPLYDLFCRATGYGGTTNVATSAPLRVIDRVFEVRFDANVRGDLPWRFRPLTTSIEVKGGEVATIEYEIENLSDQPTSGTAAYNVTPEVVGFYFNKIVCFCFTEQSLKPRETIRVPVTFFVDPEFDGQENFKKVRTITLSYSFFPGSTQSTRPVAAAKPATGAGSQL